MLSSYLPNVIELNVNPLQNSLKGVSVFLFAEDEETQPQHGISELPESVAITDTKTSTLEFD